MRIPPSSILLPGVLLAVACGGERAAPVTRDLTLAPSVESATEGAVVSARELGLPEVEQSRRPTSTAAVARHGATKARIRTPDAAGPSRPVVAPVAEQPVPESDEVADVGAGHALAPGQTVSMIPATSGAGASPVPDSDYANEHEMHRPTWVIHGDDRCIPGRGEVIPRRGPHGFHGSL